MPWGDSATNVIMQQMYMNDMGKLGPSVPGNTPTTLCQQERAPPRSLHRDASFWGTSGPVLGDLGRNGFFLGLWCVGAVVCVRLHTLPPLPHSSSNLEGTVNQFSLLPQPHLHSRPRPQRTALTQPSQACFGFVLVPSHRHWTRLPS